jgi:6-phosphogluconolactonase
MKTLVTERPDAEQVAEAALGWVLSNIRRILTAQPRCSLVLAGGSTPRQLYEMMRDLPEGQLEGGRIDLFLGDERTVPPDHPDSNERMVRQSLLESWRGDRPTFYAVPYVAGDPVLSAQRYGAVLQEYGKRNHCLSDAGPWPRLDLVLLGMGDDGHTASLFPGNTALKERQLGVVSTWVERMGCNRISLTLPLFNDAARVAFLVCGDSKRQAVEDCWNGPRNPMLHPAQQIAPREELHWLIDAACGPTQLPDGFERVDRIL